MTCERFTFPDGAVGTICSRGRGPRKRCACGALATRLCDAPRTGRKTCSNPLCGRCCVSRDGKDYCPEHAESREKEPVQGTLF